MTTHAHGKAQKRAKVYTSGSFVAKRPTTTIKMQKLKNPASPGKWVEGGGI